MTTYDGLGSRPGSVTSSGRLSAHISDGSEGPGRPTWDEWGLELAFAVSKRADCTRRKVGAVLMTPDHSVVATGYNGAPPGAPGCLSNGACPRGHSSVAPGSSYDTGEGACIALHAEQNAILRATWEDMAGSTLYVTHEPCDGCLRMIRGTPIQRVITTSSIYRI